jgi:hypothetical protein
MRFFDVFYDLNLVFGQVDSNQRCKELVYFADLVMEYLTPQAEVVVLCVL